MNYLAKLKELDGEKNYHNTPDTEPTKPSKPPFVGFEGTHTGPIVKKIVDATETGSDPHWRWRVVFSDGNVKIAAFTPPASWDDVLEFYPAAVSGQKIPDDDLKKQRVVSRKF